MDNETVNQGLAPDASALPINRTGIMVNPDLSAELIQGAQEAATGFADGDEGRIQRSEYVSEAPPLGSNPGVVESPASDEDDETKAASEQAMAVLLDKLSERLAFERQGTRLYEAFIQKVESLPIEDGEGPDLDELRQICDEELEHFKMLQQTIVELGGDATAQSPSADVAGVLSHGAMQIMADPRTTVGQALQAALTAELTDNDGWELLRVLAEQLGQDALAEQAAQALEQEQEHLDSMRAWIAHRTMAELAGAVNGAEKSRESRQRRPRAAKKKSSRSKSKRKKK